MAERPPPARARSASPAPLDIENLATATFKCVFPTCGGPCCKNGRPPVEPEEAKRIAEALPRILPHLREAAQAHIAKFGWLTKRIAAGCRTVAVAGGWCVFANGGCMLQQVGQLEGDKWKYKPSVCVRFPLVKTRSGKWFVRQWGYRAEGWDLFCLNPNENATPAAESLADEIAYSAEHEQQRKPG